MHAHNGILICLLLVGGLVLLTDALTCYTHDMKHQTSLCNYCFFSNVSTYYTDGSNKTIVDYVCLPALYYIDIHGAPEAVVNKCVVNETESESKTTTYEIYACNKDLCNTGCIVDDGNAGQTAGLSVFVAVLSALFYAAKGYVFAV